jgi:hypothetical protein
MVVMMFVIVMFMVMMLFEQNCADEIHGQRHARDRDRFVEVNRQRDKNSMNRFAGQKKGDY